MLASAPVPALPAPTDLTPRTATVTLPLPKGAGPGLRLRIVSDAAEVTQRNNVVMLEGGA